MNDVTSRRRLWLAAALVCALGLAPAQGTAAAQAAPANGVAGLAAATGRTAGFPATIDTSGGLDPCMAGPDKKTIGYRSDRIVVRPAPGTPPVTVAAWVQAALAGIGSAATVGPGPVEVIPMPFPAGGPPGPAMTRARAALTSSDDDTVEIHSVPLSHPEDQPIPVVKLARKLRQHGRLASPDYLFEGSSGPTGMWPRGYPRKIPASELRSPRLGIGGDVTIALYDVGVPDDTQANLPANLSMLTPDDEEVLDIEPDGEVDLYYGAHSVAIGSTIGTIAADATVRAVRITEEPFGIATDVSATRRMSTTLRAAHDLERLPDVIVTPWGSLACTVDWQDPGLGDMAPLGLQAITEAVERHDESIVVASAGNDGSSRAYYPAAFADVTAVGAIDTSADGDGNPWTSTTRSGKVSAFSNRGLWVDLWAPGENLPTHHVDGLRFEPNGDVLTGYGEVDGTSFSAPVVAAEVAEVLADARAEGRDLDVDLALAAVASSGMPCVKVPGRAVALTSMSDKATTKPLSGSVSAC